MSTRFSKLTLAIAICLAVLSERSVSDGGQMVGGLALDCACQGGYCAPTKAFAAVTASSMAWAHGRSTT